MKPENSPSTVLIAIAACTLLLAIIFNAQSQQQQAANGDEAVQASQWEYTFRFVSRQGSSAMEKVANKMAGEGWYYLGLELYDRNGGYMEFRRMKGQQ